MMPPKLFHKATFLRLLVTAVHAVMWSAGLGIALVLRFDGTIPPEYVDGAPLVLLVLLLCRGSSFYVFGLFHGLWRYAGMPELWSLIQASTLGTLTFGLGGLMVGILLPRSIYLGEWLASIVLIGGLRFTIRMIRERGRQDRGRTPMLIVGAGDVGESLLRDMQRSPTSRWCVEGFLDDNPAKMGAIVRGVRVLGTADAATLERIVRERGVKLVVLAIPTASGKRTREILAVCRRLAVQTKTMPGVDEQLDGKLGFDRLREVEIGDLLRRESIHIDTSRPLELIADRTVLVTGAAGSIGSELCRQSLRFGPASLVLLDHDENGLFHLERELHQKFPHAALTLVVADITDRARIFSVFERFHPELVLHAAAHKHVPMMEVNASQAVKNNVLGTSVVADAAHAFSVRAFVLLSTDKAVNPTSIMGASKRVAELVVQRRARTSATRFVAVRFGNVLGSAASVVPFFSEQIARGGPITVTHEDMRRYFMTIPEASQLVLQAAALGGTGEIFVLDMGQPLTIVSLARDLIELSGLRPDEDIAIEFTGVRPGEKLCEELLFREETCDTTPHPKIMLIRMNTLPREEFERALAPLERAALTADDLGARRLLAAAVPEATLRTPGPALVGDTLGDGLPPVVGAQDCSLVVDR